MKPHWQIYDWVYRDFVQELTTTLLDITSQKRELFTVTTVRISDSTRLHNFGLQKMILLMVTTIRTSNLTFYAPPPQKLVVTSVIHYCSKAAVEMNGPYEELSVTFQAGENIGNDASYLFFDILLIFHWSL
jgi:hypothetical protein